LEIGSKEFEEEKTKIQDFNSCLNEKEKDADKIQKLSLQSAGLIHSYKDFVQSFLSNMNIIV